MSRELPILHYCSYWGTWSRVVFPYTHPEGVTEINLTPVNPDWEHTWDEQVKPIIVRQHGTSLGRNDQWGRFLLPDPVLSRMIERIGQNLTELLLYRDWENYIDPYKLRKNMRGGGIPFRECMYQESADTN